MRLLNQILKVKNAECSRFIPQFRQAASKKAGGKYINRIEQKMAREASKPEQSYALNPMDEIFTGEPLEKAEKLEAIEMAEVPVVEKKVKKVSKKSFDKAAKKAKTSVGKKLPNKRLDKTLKKKKTVLAKKVRT